MAEVKPAEVSAILREQLAGVKTEVELQEVGTILQVGDGIARIYGLSNVQAGELVEFENSVAWNVMFGRASSQRDDASKYTLTGTTTRRG
jgi:F0F1-type ATP synthase alpha subunit